MDKIGKIYTVLESSENAVPQSLELVIKHSEKCFGSLTTNQLLMGVMYTLMLECGYTLISFEDPINGMENLSLGKDNTIESTRGFKNDQSHSLASTSFNYEQVLLQTNLLSPTVDAYDTFKLPFKLIGLPEYMFTLMMISRRGLAVVNLVVNINDYVDDCYSVAFSPSSFVQDSNNESIASKFHDLKNFSILFKDNIALKGRSHALNSLQITNNSLEGLPEEMFLRIMQFLDIDDILNVAITCTKFFSGVRQCSLWIFLLKRDFSLTLDYKGVEQLILKYREEKIKRNSNSRNGVVDIDEVDGMFDDVDELFDNPLHEARHDLNPDMYYLHIPAKINRKIN